MFIIHSTIDEHLGCFLFWSYYELSLPWTLLHMTFDGHEHSFLLSKYPKVEFLGHRALALVDSCSFPIPTSNIWEFCLFQKLAFHFGHSVESCWRCLIVVLICIFPITRESEHLLICLLVFWIFSPLEIFWGTFFDSFLPKSVFRSQKFYLPIRLQIYPFLSCFYPSVPLYKSVAFMSPLEFC